MSNRQFKETMKARTKAFVISVTQLYRLLPKSGEARIFGRQLLRSASSVGANYRAACRARSNKEFYAKISIVVEEADESSFWLEIIQETELLPLQDICPVLQESNEILAIVASARKSTEKLLQADK